jgi:hypothetical protein
MPKKLKLLWQTNTGLQDWIREIFAPVIDEEITDGQHQIVLDDCLIVDTHLHRADPTYYPRFRGRNAFLIREPDEHFRDVSGVYVNFCGVFRMHYSGVFRRERVMPLPLGYGKGLGRQETPKPASRRKYVWTMLGQINKSSRPDAVQALLPIQPNFWYASDGWRPGMTTNAVSVVDNRPSTSYREFQSESMFAPSPMGNIQQETNRPFEALEVGAIPLLEKRWSMDVHKSLLGPHPLPTFSSWKQAADFVRQLIKQPEALDQLQAECLEWWSCYKCDLTRDVETFVERHWQKPPTSEEEFVRWYGKLPGWVFLEVLRHHSASALRRRMVRQARRLIEHGRLFERI